MAILTGCIVILAALLIAVHYTDGQYSYMLQSIITIRTNYETVKGQVLICNVAL